jgi:hypothetical protein
MIDILNIAKAFASAVDPFRPEIVLRRETGPDGAPTWSIVLSATRSGFPAPLGYTKRQAEAIDEVEFCKIEANPSGAVAQAAAIGERMRQALREP